MSTSQESEAGSSSSQQSQQPQESIPLVWNRLPSIKILRPPQGRYSQNVDERCFTYCSQTINGRLSQHEPWCRTFCIRKVFNHEVKRAMAVYEKDPQTQAQNLHTVEVDAKFPLPPEGQRVSGLLDVLFGPSTSSSSSSSSSNAERESEWHAIVDNRPVDDRKYWREGWYLWMSKSRWAAQEKVDLMMCDLERQSEWQKHKEKVLGEWTSYEQGQLQAQGTVGVGDSALEDHSPGLSHPTMTRGEKQNTHDRSSAPQGPPQVIAEAPSLSLLVELPPSLPPLGSSLHAFFSPSLRLFAMTHKSLESGHQQQFANLVWQKAQTREPYDLVVKLLKHTWKFWLEDANHDDKDQKKS